MNTEQINIRQLIPHQHYKIILNDTGVTKLVHNEYAGLGKHYKRSSGSNTILLVEFIRYYDDSLIRTFCNYNQECLVADRNGEEFPILPQALEPIYEEIDRKNHYYRFRELDITDPMYPYTHMVNDELERHANGFHEHFLNGFHFNNYKYVNFDYIAIGLFRIIRIVKQNKKSKRAMRNVVVYDEDGNGLKSNDYIWINLNEIYTITKSIEQQHSSDVLSSMAYLDHRDNPYNVGDTKPPIPEDVLTEYIFPYAGFNNRHYQMRDFTKKHMGGKRSRSRGRSLVRRKNRSKNKNKRSRSRGRSRTIKRR